MRKLWHQIKTCLRQPSKIWDHSHEVKVRAQLSARVFRDGKVEDLGVICRRKVTTVFVNYLVDSMQDSTTYPMNVFKYHDSGTGVTAESNAQTALITPCGEARDTGTTIEGASANIYKTVATHTYAGSFAITEHGVFSASAAGTLLDRSVFAAINVTSGNSIEFTYQLTASAEA